MAQLTLKRLLINGFSLSIILFLAVPISYAQSQIGPLDKVAKDEYLIFEINTSNPKIKKYINSFTQLLSENVDQTEQSKIALLTKLLNIENDYLLTTNLKYNEAKEPPDFPYDPYFTLLFKNNADQLNLLISLFKEEGLNLKEKKLDERVYYQIELENGQKIYLGESDEIVLLTNQFHSLVLRFNLTSQDSILNVDDFKNTLEHMRDKIPDYAIFAYFNSDFFTEQLYKDLELQELAYPYFGTFRLYKNSAVALKFDDQRITIESYAIGNEKYLKENDITFDMVNFTPTLYKEFPNAKPFYYSETSNLKAQIKLSLKQFKEFAAQLGQESEINFNQSFEQYTDLNLEQDLLSWLDREIAFSIQDVDSFFPSLTLLINPSTNPIAAKKVTDKIYEMVNPLITSFFSNYIQLTKLDQEKTHLYEIKFNLIDYLIDNTPIKQNFIGREEIAREIVKPITLTFGLTAQNLFIFSTYPSVTAHLGEGLDQNEDFNSFFQSVVIGNGQFGYINAHNILNYFKKFIVLTQELDPKRINFQIWHTFYAIADQVGKLKDILITTFNDTYKISGSAYIRLVEKSPLSYHEFKTTLDSYETQDSDQDSRSDYEEIFIHKTDPQKNDQINLKSFKDSDDSAWYAVYIHSLANQKVVSGYLNADGGFDFKPAQPISRAEFIKMVIEGLKIKKDISNIDDLPFSDIDLNADIYLKGWALPYINTAYHKGLISGYADGTFRPNAPITRAEALKIILKAEGSTIKNIQKVAPFEDIDNHWAADYIHFAYGNKIIKGVTENRFEPNREITRAEAAKLIIETQKFNYRRLTVEPFDNQLIKELGKVLE